MIKRVSETIRQAERAINADVYFTKNPLNFQFYYQRNDTINIANTVFLEDGDPPQNLYLEVFNESSNSIKFKSLADSRPNERLPIVNSDEPNSASEMQSHFYLVWDIDLDFKPSDIEIEETDDWLVSYEETTYSLYMYFLRKTTHVLAGKDSPNKSDSRIKLTFKNLTANNRLIKSSNVVFYYGGKSRLVLVQNNNNPEVALTDQQHQSKSIYVTNDPQKLNIPLQFRLLGSDCILNNGSTLNNLQLKIINSPPSTNTRPILPLTKNSKITISFKKGDSPEALLKENDQLGSLKVVETTTSNWTLTYVQNSTKWEFTAKTNRQIGAEGEVITLSITDLVTNSASGLGYLYIDYQNIGSYPDGRLVVPIEKTPLLYKGQQVGIGTTDPSAKAKLDVKGNIRLSGNIEGGSDRTFCIYPNTNALDSRAWIEMWKDQSGRKGELTLGGTFINFYTNSIAGIDGGTAGDEGKNTMRLTSDGKLGIGTTTPKKELHVVGDLALGKDENNKKFIFHSRKDNNGDYLQITYDKSDGTLEASQGITLKRGGNVGIGTTNPDAKLHVAGGDAVIFGNVGIGTDNLQGKKLHVSGTVTATQNNQTLIGLSVAPTFDNAGKTGVNQLGLEVTTTMDTRPIDTIEVMRLVRRRPLGEKKANSVAFSVGSLFDESGIYGSTRLDIMLAGSPVEGNKWGYQPDMPVMCLTGERKVGIGTLEPLDALHIHRGLFRITNPFNTFRIQVEEKHVKFLMSYSHYGVDRILTWDGDGNWDVESDLRLKTDIDPEKNILNRLMELEVKNYRWKDEPEKLTKSIGFVAQDVKPWFPSLVGETKNSHNEETTLTLKSGAFGILAVGGLKELKLEKDAEIAELKALLHDEIAELKTQIQQLKSS
jgi:hypothetical protein